MEPFVPEHADALADLLCGEEWPFHGRGTPSRSTVLAQVAGGHWDGPGARTFWVGDRAGVIRLFDLDDGTPLFDLRLRAAHRGRGLGSAAVGWATGYLFGTLPEIRRVEANTRYDNLAMRAVLRRAGYVEEARYRQAWPAPDGSVHDAIGAAILRADHERRPDPLPLPGAVLARSGAGDAAELCVLQRCCWAAEAIANGTTDIPALHETPADVAAWVGTHHVWTVRLGGRLVGAVRAHRVGDAWEIGRLMVAPDVAGRGLGRALLEHAERQAPADVVALDLFTGSRSVRNLTMYGRAGYRETTPGARPGEHIRDAVFLRKDRRIP